MCSMEFYTAFVQGVLVAFILYIVLFLIASARRIKTAKHESWRRESIETALTATEFVHKVQKICLKKTWSLLEISDHHAAIRTVVNLGSHGMFYYIEFIPGDRNTINVYARGILFKSLIDCYCHTNLLNILYKV